MASSHQGAQVGILGVVFHLNLSNTLSESCLVLGCLGSGNFAQASNLRCVSPPYLYELIVLEIYPPGYPGYPGTVLCTQYRM
jgi:hypothetical protein